LQLRDGLLIHKLAEGLLIATLLIIGSQQISKALG
jgi:hypothetical protein